jgi:hypothetical protein
MRWLLYSQRRSEAWRWEISSRADISSRLHPFVVGRTTFLRIQVWRGSRLSGSKLIEFLRVDEVFEVGVAGGDFPEDAANAEFADVEEVGADACRAVVVEVWVEAL